MFRPVLPRAHGAGGFESADANAGARQLVGLVPRSLPPRCQRKLTKVACEECRQRKIKCDGKWPVCSACATNSRECLFDAGPGETRSAAVKRKVDEVQDQVSAQEELYTLIARRGRVEANEIVRRLRAGSDVDSILRRVKDGDLLLQLHLTPEARFRYCFPDFAGSPTAFFDPDDPYLGARLLYLEATPRHQDHVGSHAPRPPESRHSVPIPPNVFDVPYHAAHVVDPRLSSVQAARWTSVTSDDALVSKLLAIYLQFDYLTTPCFHKDLFLDDLIRGRTRFCSPMLVNAILASGAHGLMNDPRRAEFWVPSSLSYAFLAEAKRAWRLEMTEEEPKLTTIWAALILSVRHGADGATKLAIPFVQTAADMAHRMGLFTREEKGDTKISIGRAFTAWCLFSWQSMICFSYFKRPFVPKPPVTPLPDYSATHKVTGDVYLRYPGQGNFTPTYFGLTLKAITDLHVIANEINQVRPFPDDRERHPPSLQQVVAFYHRLDRWYANLPRELQPSSIAMPHQLRVHMEYHHVVIKLLEPWADPLPDTPGRDLRIDGRSLQEIAAIARTRLETVIRLYFLRHGFEFPDIILNVYLMLLGSIAVQMVQTPGPSSAAKGRHKSAFLLCMKGLHDQGRNNYLGAVILNVVSKMVDPGNEDLLNRIAEIKGSPGSVEIKPEHSQMEWPVYQWAHPSSVKISRLADALEDWSLHGDESESEPGS